MLSVSHRSPRLRMPKWLAIAGFCVLVLLHQLSITSAHAVQVTSAPVLDERLEQEMDAILEITDNKQRLQRLLASRPSIASARLLLTL